MRNSFNSFLSTTLEYQELPQKLSGEETKELLDALLEGHNVSERLIKGHMRLGMALVAERASKQWADDLVGTVFLELTKRIDWIKRKKNKKPVDHETLTPYLTHAMRHRRNDFLCTFPYPVGIKPRTLRNKNSKGEVIKLLNVSSFDSSIYLWPTSKRDYIEPEVTEILSMCIQNDLEKSIILFRAQGYTQEEVAKIINRARSRVCQISKEIEKRFYELYYN